MYNKPSKKQLSSIRSQDEVETGAFSAFLYLANRNSGPSDKMNHSSNIAAREWGYVLGGGGRVGVVA